jgi:histidinol dehydrogenase
MRLALEAGIPEPVHVITRPEQLKGLDTRWLQIAYVDGAERVLATGGAEEVAVLLAGGAVEWVPGAQWMPS